MQTRTRLRLGAAVIAVMALSGCGDEVVDGASGPGAQPSSSTASEGDSPSSGTTDPPSDPSASESEAALPDCSEVWVADQKLPAKYSGCLSENGPVKAKKYRCSYEAIIVTFDDRFYAVAGRFINEVESLKSSQKFKRALANCQA